MPHEEELKRITSLFISEALSPKLANIETETGQTVRAVVNVVENGKITLSVEAPDRLDGTTPVATAEARVVFADRHSAHGRRFKAQVIVQGLAVGTGVSGFEMEGRIRGTEASESATVSSYSIHYNVWHWKKEFSV